ncbi:uncharacterized protein LOC112552317 isoform X2 [Pogonomyrmex barbatus]|uniref:Uncharacterized protein LOC112552317 isoform X2 n=1 Tax=Pogonomyrmex barbatus TaxID=144034 RepID=A0A8N1S4T0_9HYME|nr:uncharacterized protein LOC112552317 isoform X2 [Pogonomyrmex barbatus]
MIVRSQKHLKLTIGKVADLSLKQFASLAPLSSDCPILLTRTYSANCDLYTGLPIATNSCDTSSSSSLAIPYVTLP